MANPIIVMGKSGSGKSSSIEFFDEDGVLIFNIEGKRFPFRKKFKYVAKTDSIDTIITQLNKMPCKTAVIDDAGYLMTHYFMRNHRNKKQGASFEMYDEIADIMYNLVRRIKDEVPEDVNVYLMFHEDTSDYGETKVLTLGRLLDNKVNLVGMVTIVLRCMSENGRHFFRTVTDGHDVVKTPRGMFEDDEIDNNLKAVDDAIRAYYAE